MYGAEAWRVLMANKLRSLLTVTGLIIGVGAVIAILVLGKSMAGAVNGALGSMSDDSFIVFPSSRQRNIQAAAIHLSDLTTIKQDVPGLADALPIGADFALVHAGHQIARYGISPDGATPFNMTAIEYGRRIDADDVALAANVCVISNAAYTRLFPNGGNPVGQSIHAGDRRYVVIGVLEPPRRGFLNLQFGGDVSIPWTTFLNYYVRGSTIPGARFMAVNPAQIPQLELAVINELRALHGNAANEEYQTIDKAQFTQGINGVFGAMTMVVGLIGAVSLVVAGIGIMNIMLVSVAERTREIGVRKAIGARSSQVLAQFFVESLLLCGTGCLIGLALGLGIGELVNRFAIVKLTGYVAATPWLLIFAVTIGFAVVVTLLFGTYPAYRASKLDPIEALRYE
jgi:putative ABC transport system permease protein